MFTRVLKALFAQDLADQGEELNAFELTKRRWQAMIATMDGEGYNTPKNVDELANLAILKAWEKAAGDARKRLVLLSSIGVQRRTQMPFPVLNACGVLDAKASAERALADAAARGGFEHAIVRPGQLFGGPYDNNFYLGTLFQLDKDADTRGVALSRGDDAQGDTLARARGGDGAGARDEHRARSDFAASTSRAMSRASRWCGSAWRRYKKIQRRDLAAQSDLRLPPKRTQLHAAQRKPSGGSRNSCTASIWNQHPRSAPQNMSRPRTRQNLRDDDAPPAPAAAVEDMPPANMVVEDAPAAVLPSPNAPAVKAPPAVGAPPARPRSGPRPKKEHRQPGRVLPQQAVRPSSARSCSAARCCASSSTRSSRARTRAKCAAAPRAA